MRQILFVCTANIARSPMAEALFNRFVAKKGLADQYEAQSAGTWGRDGFPAAPEGIEMMAERDFDIRSHRSRVVREEIIASADLILTMEQGHKEALQIEFPQQKENIYMLTELVGPPYDIPDPYGQGLDAFQETAQELETIITKGFDEIFKRANSNSK
jgi:protein-tyrosine-phosphatase